MSSLTVTRLSARATTYRFVAAATTVVLANNLVLGTVAAESRLVVWLSNALLVAAALTWTTRVEKLSLSDLGFRRAGLRLSLTWGLIAGLAMALPPLIFFAFPIIAPEPVRYQGYVGLGPAGLLATVFVHQLLSTAFCEETLFRGWMQAQAVRGLGLRGGLALTCALFVLWHVVVTWRSLWQTSLTASIIPVPVLYALAAVPLGLGGLIFSAIRHQTGNIAGCILAHWTVNCLMLISLVVQGSRGG